MLVRTDGKQFCMGGRRFRFHGVTYGTFRAREDGSLVPERDRLKLDLIAIAEAGFTVIRTYTQPPDDLLEVAADWDLRVMSDIFYLDWRYLIGSSRRQLSRIAAEARRVVRAEARRLAGNEQILALSLGNEVPADVVRWIGAQRIAGVIDGLAAVVHDEDPDRLVTYANYPTTEYLTLEGLDFLTFNVFLENDHDLRRYLARLQNLAGDRPLVLGEIGRHAGNDSAGEIRQAECIDRQLGIALERGVAGTCLFSWTDDWWVNDKPVDGWQFGLTRADRSPKPALEIAERWNGRTVRDLRDEWPSMSVVICAYNAASTLDECLSHTCSLDYPNLEVIVVDDGSTDGTLQIAGQHPRAKLISINHVGLGTARNEGFRRAEGDIVAYLDADAFPSPEWPYYIALGFDSRLVGGVGGPNVPPPDDPPDAQMVARSPGGPAHVLLSDDRAEHVPGCNMAFWKGVLTEVGGFDPVYTAAGDDVDLCWKVLDKGWEIGFCPAALVWHRRRGGLAAYLRQQQGYGKAEAVVEARHPDRFGPLHSASWRGRIYNTFVPQSRRQRIYRGVYGSALFQSIYRTESHGIDIAHQVGLPLALLVLLATPLLVIAGAVVVPALAIALVLSLGAIDTARVTPPRKLASGRLRFRMGVAILHLLQPLVRTWSRLRNGAAAGRSLEAQPLPAMSTVKPNLRIFAADRPREQFVEALASHLRRAGVRMASATGWEDYDLSVLGSSTVEGVLTTSAFPEGCIQLRIRRKIRLRSLAAMAALAALGAWWLPGFSAAVVAVMAVEIARGWFRIPAIIRRVAEEPTR